MEHKKWEYISIPPPPHLNQDKLEIFLNHWGNHGWELVVFEHGWAIFKRAIINKVEQ